MKKSIIFARRIQAGRSGSPIGWDGVSDFSAWYTKNKSADSSKAALRLFTINDIARTGGQLNGLIVEVEAKAGVELWTARGANISLYIPSNTPVSGGPATYGLHVEAQGGLSIAGDWYAAYIYNAPGAQPTSISNGVMKLEANVTADNRNRSWIEFVGGKGQYVMAFGPLQTQTAWAFTGTPTNIAGWFKVLVGLADRWVALYDTAP